MNLKETTVNKNYIYKGKIINVRCDDAALPDGKMCKREIVEHPGGASVLCVKDKKVLLVKQYRYAYQEEIYEIPAGKLNLGEDPALTAARELKEETGMEAREMKHLFTLYPTPGYTNELLRIYYAVDAKEGEAMLDEGEFLNVEWLELEKVVNMIESGEISDAKTVVAVQWYLLHERN
ncbi:MAG: NUDIX hydrolase [Clostridia bacterium]|nr:NUDIX hydrolase [Clostridia bacterium]